MYAQTIGLDKMYALETQIKKHEEAMNVISNKKFCNKIKSEKFLNVYNNYKYLINALMNESNYFVTIREICMKNENDLNEIDFSDAEHYDYIQKYKKFGKKLLNVIKFSRKFDIINNFEYRMLKNISKLINNVWKTDEIFSHVHDWETYDIPTFKEVEFYFCMLDIIFKKISGFNIGKEMDCLEILDNDDYMGLITELKKSLEYDNNSNQDISYSNTTTDEEW